MERDLSFIQTIWYWGGSGKYVNSKTTCFIPCSPGRLINAESLVLSEQSDLIVKPFQRNPNFWVITLVVQIFYFSGKIWVLGVPSQLRITVLRWVCSWVCLNFPLFIWSFFFFIFPLYRSLPVSFCLSLGEIGPCVDVY